MLKIDGVDCRSHSVMGIFALHEKIVFLHSILGDVPREDITKNTTFPYYIVADFFSADLLQHTQGFLVYHERKTLFETCCHYKQTDSGILVNTMHYRPNGGIFVNTRDNTLAKLIEVRDGSVSEVGESPAPTDKVFSEQQTFSFCGLDVKMSSKFIMECRSQATDEVVWTLRLNAWLYTDIEERSGILYFGTAGRGGRFYGVSATDGRVLFAYDTGGTVFYTWYQNNVLLADRTGRIVMLDFQTGAEIKAFAFNHPDKPRQKLVVCSRLLVKGDKVYAVGRPAKDFYDFYALYADLL